MAAGMSGMTNSIHLQRYWMHQQITSLGSSFFQRSDILLHILSHSKPNAIYRTNKRRLNLGFSLLITTSAIFALCAVTISSTDAADSLLGNIQSCSNEGEEFKIESIRNSKCYKCTCQNGFVNCYKLSCPPIDDCYLLDPMTPGTCCKHCKGCTFNGVFYPSGSEWSAPDDPCRTYKCVASVITETTMKCFTQCDENQKQPPGPGECCATCKGCEINGQTVGEGQEVVASIDDRCLVCQCLGNKLSCSKKTCPILQCPISKQKQHPKECCPRCTEHREFMPVKGKCFFNNKVFYERTNFTPDRCTNCTCTNGTSICHRNTCPILDCAPEYQESDGGCCSRCITSEVRSECIHNGVTYQNNDTWNLDLCRFCRCSAGNIRCSEMRCAEVKCKPNEEMKILPGECCPKCVESAASCTVFGDPHFKTFDGKFYSFQGSCKYILAADCRDHSFSIRLTNDGRGTKRSSWAKTVTLKMRGFRVNLGQKLRVKVNGSRVDMPYSHEEELSIERLTEGILLKTKLGLKVQWDGNNFLQVEVPASYKTKLCGLCGNYNGFVRDDLTGRNGKSFGDQEVWDFADSWKVGGNKTCSRKDENNATQPICKQRKSNIYCQPLRESEVFGNCDSKLNPINYIESCKMDMCECPSSMCFCDSFNAYAHECERLGVQLPDWREFTNCARDHWKVNQTRIILNKNGKPRNGSTREKHSQILKTDHQRKQHRQRKHQQRQQEEILKLQMRNISLSSIPINKTSLPLN